MNKNTSQPKTNKSQNEDNAGKTAENKDMLIQHETKITELTNDLKRVQADFENHIKRVEKQKNDWCEQAGAKVLIKFLSLADDLNRAIKILEDSKIDSKLLEGIKMVNSNLSKTFETEGVMPIDCIGKSFDPFKAEVIRRVKKQGVKEDIVLEEHVKGYMLNGKVLRYAKVTVSEGD